MLSEHAVIVTLQRLLIVLVASFAVFRGGLAQDSDRGVNVESLSFVGNETFGDGDLLKRMTTRESPGFFGSLLYSISESFGTAPQFYSPTSFGADLLAIERLYEDYGFSEVSIDTSLQYSEDKQEVNILVQITEGYRSLIDAIEYSGLTGVAGEALNGISNDPLIEPGDPFSKAIVDEEVRRIREVFANEGYPNNSLVRDSSAAIRLVSTRNYQIILHFDPGNRYRFGEINISQESDDGMVIADDVIMKQLDYKQGAFYSESKRRSSERNLNRLGVFSQARIHTDVPPDTVFPSEVASLVSVRPADKHEVLPEVSVSDEDKEFNIGAGVVYLQRNFLGGGRTFSTRLRFRTQTLRAFPEYFDVNSESVSNLDLSFEILQPYFFSNKIRGSWTFSLILDKQKLYRQEIVKNTFAFTDRLGVHTDGFLDWTLQQVRLQQNTTIEYDTTDPDIRRQLNALRALEQNVQFNSILSFTIQRDKSNDLFNPSQGFIHALTLEESGLLPLLLKSAQPNVPFTQFYRAVFLGRWYFDLTPDRFSLLAFKFKGGFEDKYGESRSDTTSAIPQTHRFYSGGGGSIRGWPARGLIASGSPELGGNLALEGSVEVRTNLFRSLREDFLDNLWIVTFLDVGNVWLQAEDYHVKDVALATGMGFRYDTFFGPFRIDFGIRVYDPRHPDPNKRWITERKFFGETVSDGVLHFGIGHAF